MLAPHPPTLIPAQLKSVEVGGGGGGVYALSLQVNIWKILPYQAARSVQIFKSSLKISPIFAYLIMPCAISTLILWNGAVEIEWLIECMVEYKGQ